jgi:hypothetical protein
MKYREFRKEVFWLAPGFWKLDAVPSWVYALNSQECIGPEEVPTILLP